MNPREAEPATRRNGISKINTIFSEVLGSWCPANATAGYPASLTSAPVFQLPFPLHFPTPKKKRSLANLNSLNSIAARATRKDLISRQLLTVKDINFWGAWLSCSVFRDQKRLLNYRTIFPGPLLHLLHIFVNKFNFFLRDYCCDSLMVADVCLNIRCRKKWFSGNLLILLFSELRIIEVYQSLR